MEQQMKSKLERLKELESIHAKQYADIGAQLVDAKNQCETAAVNQLIVTVSALSTLRMAQALEQIVFILGEPDNG